MQNAQEIYTMTVSHLPSSEQLLLASLILEGITQTQREPEPTPELSPKPARRSMLDLLEDWPGGQLFKTSAEADAYLREERDSWDR